jgi:hypothetical protein
MGRQTPRGLQVAPGNLVARGWAKNISCPPDAPRKALKHSHVSVDAPFASHDAERQKSPALLGFLIEEVYGDSVVSCNNVDEIPSVRLRTLARALLGNEPAEGSPTTDR